MAASEKTSKAKAKAKPSTDDPRLEPIHDWFAQRNWTPLPFQQETWSAYLAGRNGLIQVPTGSGKTFAAVKGPIARMLAEEQTLKGMRLLYITAAKVLPDPVGTWIKPFRPAR